MYFFSSVVVRSTVLCFALSLAGDISTKWYHSVGMSAPCCWPAWGHLRPSSLPPPRGPFVLYSPCHDRARQQMGPRTAQIMARLPGASNQQTRHARRLYIGACPKTTEEEMTNFFNDAINRALAIPIDGGPVQSVYVSQDKVRWSDFRSGCSFDSGGCMVWGGEEERVFGTHRGCWRHVYYRTGG